MNGLGKECVDWKLSKGMTPNIKLIKQIMLKVAALQSM